MKLPSRRLLYLAGFLACAGVMGFAALHNPSGQGRRVYAALVLIAAGGGAAVAARHVWLQNLPPDKVPSCGPGLGYMLDNFPVGDALRMVFTGSGECAEVVWRLLGLSMPSWVLVGMTGLGAYGIWNSLRLHKQ